MPRNCYTLSYAHSLVRQHSVSHKNERRERSSTTNSCPNQLQIQCRFFLLCKTIHSTRTFALVNGTTIFMRIFLTFVGVHCECALLYHLYMQFPLQSIDFHFIFLPAFFIYSISFSVYNLAQQSRKKNA